MNTKVVAGKTYGATCLGSFQSLSTWTQLK